MPTATAVFNGKTIAKAESWETVEGNVYVSTTVSYVLPIVETDVRSSRPRMSQLLSYRLSLLIESSSLDKSVLSVTDTHTLCPWKGVASYYTIKVDGMCFDVDCSRSGRLISDGRQGSERRGVVLS